MTKNLLAHVAHRFGQWDTAYTTIYSNVFTLEPSTLLPVGGTIGLKKSAPLSGVLRGGNT